MDFTVQLQAWVCSFLRQSSRPEVREGDFLCTLVLSKQHDEHGNRYYDATDVYLVALLDRVCDVLSARINRGRCVEDQGRLGCDACGRLRERVDTGRITEIIALANLLAIMIASSVDRQGASAVADRLSSLTGYSSAIVEYMMYDETSIDKELTPEEPGKRRVNITNLRYLVGMSRVHFAALTKPFKVLCSGRETFLSFFHDTGLVTGPLINDGQDGQALLQKSGEDLAVGSEPASSRTGYLFRNKKEGYNRVENMSDVRCYGGRKRNRFFVPDSFWQAVVFSIAVRNRSLPLAPVVEEDFGSMLRILKEKRKGRERAVPNVNLPDPTLYFLLKSTMAKIVYGDNRNTRDCAIAGFEYHGTVFRITSASEGSCLRAQVVQRSILFRSEAAQSIAGRCFNSVALSSGEPGIYGVYHIIVDGKVRCAESLRNFKII